MQILVRGGRRSHFLATKRRKSHDNGLTTRRARQSSGQLRIKRICGCRDAHTPRWRLSVPGRMRSSRFIGRVGSGRRRGSSGLFVGRCPAAGVEPLCRPDATASEFAGLVRGGPRTTGSRYPLFVAAGRGAAARGSAPGILPILYNLIMPSPALWLRLLLWRPEHEADPRVARRQT
jgi:hypothetical protein